MPVPPVIQMYRYVMGSGGLGNLLKSSEEFQQTVDWVRYPTSSQTPTVNADSRPDPNGGTTADQVGFTANTSARLMQTVTLSASTEYTFSVHARAVSGTVDFRMRNVTLKDSEVKTATTTGPDGGGFTRFTYTFTTGAAGSYELALQNDTNATAKDVIFWGAMLNEGGTALDYQYAAPTTGGSAPAPAYAGFGDSFGGVTAYYSLRQFTEAETLNAIRVRRSSDDTEQDIGFDANGDLDTTALTTFVNADYNTHTSDFSSGTDGWFANGATADGNIDGISDGTTSKDDVLRLTLSGGAISHSVRLNGAIDVGNVHDVSFEYYIPSGQTMDGILFRTDNGVDGNYQQSVVGTWTSVTIEDWSITQGDQFRVYATDGGSTTVDGDGDVFYLKNIVVTQTTADGAVTTFYDQSGNGNHATNATASEQPLVVSGGSVIVDASGFPEVKPDGIDDYLEINNTGISIPNNSLVFSVSSYNDDADGIILSNVESTDYDNCISIGSNFQGSNSGVCSVRLGGVVGTRGSFNESKGGFIVGDKVLTNTLVKSAFSDSETLFNGQSADGTVGHRANVSDAGFFMFRAVNFYGSSPLNEVVLLTTTDQSANRTGMETNINDHFDIYTP